MSHWEPYRTQWLCVGIADVSNVPVMRKRNVERRDVQVTVRSQSKKSLVGSHLKHLNDTLKDGLQRSHLQSNKKSPVIMSNKHI